MFVQYGKDNPGSQEFLISHPLQQSLSQPVRGPVLILMSAVAFILLIACANLAGLTLVRVIRRSGELATRLALGATRASLMRQLTMEPLILTLAGGVAGVALANAGLGLFQRLLPPDLLPIGGLSIDHRVLAFAFMASLATALFIGMLPAFEVRRAEIRPSLASSSARSGGAVHTRTRQALIAGEVMLTVVLLAGAGPRRESRFEIVTQLPVVSAVVVIENSSCLLLKIERYWPVWFDPAGRIDLPINPNDAPCSLRFCSSRIQDAFQGCG
jgi:hypothetical protein